MRELLLAVRACGRDADRRDDDRPCMHDVIIQTFVQAARGGVETCVRMRDDDECAEMSTRRIREPVQQRMHACIFISHQLSCIYNCALQPDLALSY